MKKQLLITAVTSTLAAVPVAANAAAEVYGRAIAVMQSCANCNSTDETWEMTAGGSRLGFKGSEDLGEGLKAIYQFEFGVATDGSTNSLRLNEGGVIDLNGDGDMTDTGVQIKGESTWDPGNRPKWVGLTGGFGTIKAGRQFHPQWDYVAGPTDLFSEGMIRNLFGNRASDLLYYNSPKIGMFDVGLAGTFTGGSDGEDVDESQIGARLDLGVVKVAVVAGSVKNALFGDKQGASVIYKDGAIQIVGAYEKVEISTTVEREVAILIGEFTFGSEVFLIGYGTQEDEGATAKPNTVKAEYRHNFSKGVRLWLAGIANDSDSTVDDETQIQFGMRMDF